MHFNFNRKNFGIDLGNNNTLVSDEHKILFDQPSYIVFDSNQKSVKAVGDAAFDMFEKTHRDLRTVKPMKRGVIADYDSAIRMISEIVKCTSMRQSFYQGFDHIIGGIPYTTTEVEKIALSNALEQFRARKTSLVFEPFAAAMGMGLNIQEPDGKMVVDMGGGITEIVIISLSGIASVESLKVSGDSMDSEIQDHFRREYNMAIGLKTAEQVKIQAGAVWDKLPEVPEPITVKGKDLMRGIPATRSVRHYEVAAILERSMMALETGIINTLQKCPPELSADIYNNGIYVTGGNALLRGLKERLEYKIGLPVIIDNEPLLSVSKGIATILRDPRRHRSVLFEK